MRKLRVMILCGRSPRHLYVANRLSQVSEPVAIVQEIGVPWRRASLRKILRPAVMMNKAWRWARDRRRYVGGREAAFFFGREVPALDRLDLLVKTQSVNDDTVVALAQRLDPDLIAVFGTSLIRGPLLKMGRLGIVNLHGGLSPEYRGADCTFWALYNGEPEQVGCTLHRIDPGIDTGHLIAHICPEVRPDDDELTLFWRAVRDGAEVYAELVERLQRGEELGQTQRGKGRLYQVKQRRLRDELALARRLRAGLLRGTCLPKRVRWFVNENGHPEAQRAGTDNSCATLPSH